MITLRPDLGRAKKKEVIWGFSVLRAWHVKLGKLEFFSLDAGIIPLEAWDITRSGAVSVEFYE
jgi:hypothetical protein